MIRRKRRRARRSRVPMVDIGTPKRAAISSYDSPSTCRRTNVSRRRAPTSASAARTSPFVSTSRYVGSRGVSAASPQVVVSRLISRTAILCR